MYTHIHSVRAMSATMCVCVSVYRLVRQTVYAAAASAVVVPTDAALHMSMSSVLCVCVARYIQINMSTKQARSND